MEQTDIKQVVLEAIGYVLKGTGRPCDPVETLDSEALSNPDVPCTWFSPAVFERVCTQRKQEYKTTTYKKGDRLPVAFDDGSFVNIAMIGDPSGLNHVFNILVSGADTYLIQTFVNCAVPVVQKFATPEFLKSWHDLATDEKWQDAYVFLFGVTPEEVQGKADVPGAVPEHSWLQEQHVSI